MLLCLTTFFIPGFQSCQKETPHLLEVSHELDQIEPLNRSAFEGDIEIDDDFLDCECCIRILEVDVNLDEGDYALRFAGGNNGNTNPCTSDLPIADCPYFDLQHGDCRDELDSSPCTTLVNANDSDRCHPLNCSPELGAGPLFFSATLFTVDPLTCEKIEIPDVNAEITYAIECKARDVRCYSGIDDDGTSNDDPNPPVPTNPTTYYYEGTITLNNFQGGTYFGGQTLPSPSGECCELEF